MSFLRYISRSLHRNSCFQISGRCTADSIPLSTGRNFAAKTYYELFPETLKAGPPPAGTFHVDSRALRGEFLQLQAVSHPDRHAASAKGVAEAESAQINEAYSVLQNSLARAQYLLSLKGINVTADDMATPEPELLMEVMEVMEAIDETVSQNDLEKLRSINSHKIKRSEDILEKAFGRDDWEDARRETIRLRYWTNIKNRINDLEYSGNGGEPRKCEDI
ncbi:BgTH12-06145 [Blumeria graminis f. sp. triticale]|uniref:Specialized J-protein n=4 Tax=Blumeria graminis TaxID=34373 RepID=A0A656KJP6_BLUGR|nr:Specialized J-protein [Blumeria graminis f. sp. tritici 96224]CAD6504415.1 BgTH12-06145 [Blumeria graminis f. sp. triticale]VDB91267.1 Bgt-3489 [Blumeria graminis f. sp. tritici]